MKKCEINTKLGKSHEGIILRSQTIFFYIRAGKGSAQWMAFNKSKKLHLTLTQSRVEASANFPIGGIPDSFFPHQYERKSGLAVQN